MQSDLTNFIKYCLGYVKITRASRTIGQQKDAVNLPADYLALEGLLNGDSDGNLGELLNFATFYKYDPKKVPEEEKEKYEEEKKLVKLLEDIYNKYKNDQFTKEIILNFGYFQVELPIEISEDEIVQPNEPEQLELPLTRTRIDRYPLFALPIKIEKTFDGISKYYAYTVESEIQVNVGMLESILGEDLYFQLLEQLSKYEAEQKLTLPVLDLKVFTDIWHNVKAQLKNTEANFDENSFSLAEIRVALSSKANYFLAEDLAKLSKLTEEELQGTALTSWIDEFELNIDCGVPQEKELFFPFNYDKYQVQVLSLVGNRASIIQGPPGTGKSETIANMLAHFAATNKRVLFVSQKAQALKVVKDKLKKLEVPYLFGYLPNPASAQLGEEDETDGIAPQLAGLGSYIEKLGYGHHSKRENTQFESLEESVNGKDTFKKEFNNVVDFQRRYYQLSIELESLRKFNIEVNDLDSFAKNFSVNVFEQITDLLDQIKNLKEILANYESLNEEKIFKDQFIQIDFAKKVYAEPVLEIKNYVATKGYDRHSKLFRAAHNAFQNLKLSKARAKLPREIIDYIDAFLNADISKNEATKAIEQLHRYCSYYENRAILVECNTLLEKLYFESGINDLLFKRIVGVIKETSQKFTDVKINILKVYEIKEKLKELTKVKSINTVSPQIKSAELDRRAQVTIYLKNIIDNRVREKWAQGSSIRSVIQKLAKAFLKSKKAFKTFDNLRKDSQQFKTILDLIPIWIMELDDASRILPLEANLFDYVILDEASQCNVAYTLPVMFRSQKAIFVGDSEQMRDSTVMFKSNRVFDELARRYQIPDASQIKATGAGVQSVLDIAKNKGFMYRTLRYHYRSPRELIGFSNHYFYKPNGKELIPLNSNYLTYQKTNKVMLIHEIKSDWKEEVADNVNIEEAKAILKLFKELRDDEKYLNKSIGILAFFNAQATYIRELLEKEGYRENTSNYRVSVVEGIQGDEKDIIIYSFVIRREDQVRNYRPLTGEGGDIQAEINKGRVNVAFSRARLQTHCFVSMPVEDLPNRIWIKKYLQYVQDNGEVDFYDVDLKKFDSGFEEDFYQNAIQHFSRGYKIQNQVASCGFKIDFVLTNNKNGKRLAIECDGPTHFKDEIDEVYGIYVENDEERQNVLEAAGWKFYRIKYSDWIDEKFNKVDLYSNIAELLN